MTTTTKFCTVADVKAQLNITDDPAYTADDAGITAQIINATALIRAFTRRDWETGTHVQFFDTQDINIAIRPGQAMARFTLKEQPLQSITSAVYHTGGDFDNGETLQANIEYYTDLEKNQLIMYPSYMSRNLRALKVTYVAGYPVNGDDALLLDVDAGLKAACAIQAAFSWRRIINETSGKSQKQDRKGFANYSVGANGLVREAQAMIRGKTRLLTGTNG